MKTSDCSFRAPHSMFIGCILCLLLVVANACKDKNVEPTESQYSADSCYLEYIGSSSGFGWYNQERDRYIPDTVCTSIIHEAYVSDPFRTLLFVNPSCTCLGTQYYLPALGSTYKTARILDANALVYIMRTVNDEQPYKKVYPLQHLQTFYLVRKSGAVIKIEPPEDIHAKIEQILADKLK